MVKGESSRFGVSAGRRSIKSGSSVSAVAATQSAAEAAEVLAQATGVAHHDAVVVLGSGWDAAADVLGTLVAELPVASLPGFRAPVAPGHRGLARSYDLDGLAVLAYLGRTHLYEGHGPGPVAHPVRVAAAAGARVAVLANASGGLRADWPPGTGALIADHINLTFVSPLTGPEFVDLTDAWSPQLRGPSVQTVAETGMLRTLGADLVGMSTVVEAIAARAAGLELLGLSAVTTLEGTGEELDPDDVLAVAEATARRVAGVLPDVLGAVRDDLPTTN